MAPLLEPGDEVLADPRAYRRSPPHPGDIVVAGRNFGVGSAREQAAMVLQHLGVGAVLAISFGRIFYRNALNFGVPVLVFPQAGEIEAGARLRVDAVAGRVSDLSAGRDYELSPLPAHLLEMVRAGGLLPHLKARIAAGERWGPRAK